MALGAPYATVEQLQARLGVEDDGSFAQLLDAASRTVESFTRRQFNRADEATPRRYRSLDRERVAVDDFHTTEDLEVEVRGVAWDVEAHVDPRPWDGVVGAMVNWPFSDLFAVGRCWPWSRRALITVTARWGWASVPAGIVLATLDVAEVMSMSTTSQTGSIRSEAIGGYSISYALPMDAMGDDVPPELIKALPFRRKVFGVA